MIMAKGTLSLFYHLIQICTKVQQKRPPLGGLSTIFFANLLICVYSHSQVNEFLSIIISQFCIATRQIHFIHHVQDFFSFIYISQDKVGFQKVKAQRRRYFFVNSSFLSIKSDSPKAFTQIATACSSFAFA